jgi:hypothetical protein
VPAPRVALGAAGIRPVAGVWLTVLRVGRGADRLRGAEWGGTIAVVALTLGGELSGPRAPSTPTSP